MRAAIMQPTYLSWMGYFALIDSVDVFILDDLSQYVAKSWHSRNRIRTRDGQVVWLTVPVHGHRAPLNTIQIDYHQRWQEKHWRTIWAAYGNTRGEEILDGIVFEMGRHKWAGLTDYTGHLIRDIAQEIDITTTIVDASNLGPLRPGIADRIADMCQAVHATSLVNTITASAYLDESMIGLPIEWMDYQHPVYPQPPHQDFVSHFSVLDCLAHCGEDTLTTIRSGVHTIQCEQREERASKR